MLNNTRCCRMDCLLSCKRFWISRQKYSLALATCLRFDNESPIALVVNFRQEFLEVFWQVVSRWEKVVVIGKDCLQAHQMSTKHVFLCQVVNARKMICPLVRLHSLKQFDSDRAIVPRDIPSSVHPLRQMVLEVELCHLFDHIIVRVIGIHHESICLVCDVFGVQLALFVILITRSEPIRII